LIIDIAFFADDLIMEIIYDNNVKIPTTDFIDVSKMSTTSVFHWKNKSNMLGLAPLYDLEN